MPSTMTHTYFGLDVYNELPKNYQNKINNKLEHYKLFCQGSDPLMFYHFFIGKQAKKAAELQKEIHTNNTKKFFTNIINYININNANQNQEIMSYLYGNICHYFLDLYTHPFIYYKSGKFNKNNKETYKYNGIHQEIEYNIDLYMIKLREKEKPYKFKIYKYIFKIPKFDDELKNIIENTLQKTYNTNALNMYISSIHYMKLFFKYINYDPYGIKLKIYKLIDKITKESTIRLEELSYYHNFEKNLSYLNLEHKTWYYPWDKTQKQNTSFFDLYNIAKEKSLQTIITITNLIEEKTMEEKKLNELFQDLSYTTGKPCKEKVKMKYFEF